MTATLDRPRTNAPYPEGIERDHFKVEFSGAYCTS
jgi:hypothetical protein